MATTCSSFFAKSSSTIPFLPASVAALWVLLYHAWVLAKPRPVIVDIWDWQVDLTPFFPAVRAVSPFFVLSGFLLGLPFAQWQAGRRDRPQLRPYLWRRVMRVFPAYYAQLALLILITWLPHGQIPPQDGATLWRHLLMLFNPPPLGTTPINAVWWTLPIEFSFYLALPFLALLLRPRRWWWLLILTLTTMCLWRAMSVTLLADSPVPARVLMSYQLPGSLDSFGLGMLGAALYVHRIHLGLHRLTTRQLGALGLGALGLMMGLLYWGHYHYLDYWTHSLLFYTWTPLFAVAAVALQFAGVGGCRLTNALFANRIMVFAGVISYSVYLWHYPIMEWLQPSAHIHAVDGYRLPYLLTAALGLTLLAAALSYALIERPCMRLRHQPTR